MSKESNPGNWLSEKPKAILCFIGSGVLTLSTLGLAREVIRGNWAAVELMPTSFVGGIGLGAYGVELITKARKPDDGDDNDNGSGGWEPEPETPSPSGGGLEFDTDPIPDYMCDPSLWQPVKEPIPELV